MIIVWRHKPMNLLDQLLNFLSPNTLLTFEGEVFDEQNFQSIFACFWCPVGCTTGLLLLLCCWWCPCLIHNDLRQSCCCCCFCLEDLNNIFSLTIDLFIFDVFAFKTGFTFYLSQTLFFLQVLVQLCLFSLVKPSCFRKKSHFE